MAKEAIVDKIEKDATPQTRRLLSPLLWDTDSTKLDLERDKFAIIERVMIYGRPEHIRWMNARYPEDDLAQVVKVSRNIDKKTANYWCIHLKIPLRTTRCFST
jgi:hypothetical protein